MQVGARHLGGGILVDGYGGRGRGGEPGPQPFDRFDPAVGRVLTGDAHRAVTIRYSKQIGMQVHADDEVVALAGKALKGGDVI